MNRSIISALISLACVAPFPAIAQTAGAGEVQVTLSAAANPTASGVMLTGTVQPVIKDATMPPPHPAGTVTFFDGSTALGSAVALTAGAASNAATFAQVFGAPDPAMVNFPAPPPSEVSGDFNGDGSPDVLLYGTDINLSNPGVTSGTLQLQVFASVPGEKFVVLPMQKFSLPPGAGLVPSTGTLAILDVDGDGRLDVLDGNLVFRGKGDGTFANPSILPILATGFTQGGALVESYAVDVNGDGKPDIVAVNAPPLPNIGTGTIQYAFTVFRNDGGGTFTSLGSFSLAAPFDAGAFLCCSGFNIFGLSFADFNGDGKMDILSQSNRVPLGNSAEPNQLNVMLNNGDGTFGPVKAVDTSSIQSLGYDATAFAELNGDGKLDLVLGYSLESGGNYVATALGNGDGTFGAFQTLLLGDQRAQGVPPYVQLIDFDLDGKIDAAFGSGELALGNGDGTFSLSTPLFPQPGYVFGIAQPVSYPLMQATLFPDSLPSLIYLNLPSNQTNGSSGGNAVFTPADSSSATTTAMLTAGSHSLTAHYSGDASYAASVSPAVTIEVAPAATKTTITSSANPSYAGESVTFTAAIAGLAPGAGGMVTFSNGSTTLGTAAVSNGSASFATTFSSAGNQTITAAYGGDDNDAASSGNLSQSVVVSPISFPTPSGSTTLTGASGSAAFGSVTIDAVAGYSGLLSLTCSGLPANASCSFTPQIPTITAPSGGYGIIVTLYSPAPVLGKVNDSATPPGAVEWCGVSLLSLLLVGRIRRSRVGRLCLILAAGVFVSLTGCGGGSKSTTTTSSVSMTPPGTYTFQLNASTGQVNGMPYSSPVSQTYKLIVQ